MVLYGLNSTAKPDERERKVVISVMLKLILRAQTEQLSTAVCRSYHKVSLLAEAAEKFRLTETNKQTLRATNQSSVSFSVFRAFTRMQSVGFFSYEN